MRLTQQQLETHLWGAANILRGKTAGQDYKTYILSLMFYKRLCDQWDNETDDAIVELEREQGRPFTEAQKAVFRSRGEHRFSIPEGAHWGDVLAVSTDIGEKLTEAMRAVSNANEELRGVFTVDWNQPAPDGSGKKLIPNEVVHALIQHFDEIDLSNKSVPSDVLGRAYEYLIKKFADDAGAKAGEFFTPPEVVDTLVRILEPQPGETIYDPTCGSGGMLIHSADFIKENGHRVTTAQYFGQEMNWSNYAIGKINSVLHGLEADIRGGASTITDPQFTDEHGKVKKFSLVLANFPFSDEFWWIRPELQTDDKKKLDKLKKEVFGKSAAKKKGEGEAEDATGGYKDKYGRFGRGTGFRSPPPGYGDYAFILHILASLKETGRAGVVCPQGVLFRGQPEVEEETGEFDDDGNPKMKRRKADDEHLIRSSLLESRLIDAIISLPLNVFYGAGVPACLLIMRKQRPTARHDQVLLVYAARHFRELSNQNELRPQDVMRMLVHYHAYGDAGRVQPLVEQHSGRIRALITERERLEVERLEAEYAHHVEKLAEQDRAIAALKAEGLESYSLKEEDKLKALQSEIAEKRAELETLPEGKKRAAALKKLLSLEVKRTKAAEQLTKRLAQAEEAVTAKRADLEKQREKVLAKLAERDERIAETRRRAEDDRQDVVNVGDELVALYNDPDELLKHARVVGIDEIEENEFNLNIPRYVDTFEPEQRVEVGDALKALHEAEKLVGSAEKELTRLLEEFGYSVQSNVIA